MGCARESALEGLSDHLLALRAVLEGHGPVGASLPMRASALISDESCDRIEARGRVESAMELERALMNGAPTKGGIELAAWIEEGARRMLRDAALGELGTDLNTAADETLIATGLDGGDMDITRQRRRCHPSRHARTRSGGARRFTAAKPRPRPTTNLAAGGLRAQRRRHPDHGADPRRGRDSHRRGAVEDFSISEPVPAEDEIRITATNWLDEVSVEKGTMEWTAAQSDGIGDRERVDTPRVRHLFPVPEDADWEVRELELRPLRPRRGLAGLEPGGERVALLAAGEQVAVDLGQPGEVVDVLVQVGDADHALAAQLPLQPLDVGRVALGERLVVGEVVGDAPGQGLVAQSFGQLLPQVRVAVARRLSAG